jgi:hypothetical protein
VTRRLARQQIELRHGQSAFTDGADDVHRRIQRHHGDRQIGRMRRDTVVRRAEDGEVAVLALDRRAAGSGLALVTGHGDVLEIATPGPLQQISGGGGGVTDLP